MKKFIIIFGLFISMETVWPQEAKPAVHIAIIGLVHDHAYGFIPLTRDRPDVQLVGIVEPDRELAASYAKRFNLDTHLFYTSLEALLAKTPCRPSRPRWIIDAWWKCARLCIST
jgi:predicted dehydrogenase